MPNPQCKIGDGPVRVKALRLGRRSGSSWVTGVCRHAVPTLRSQRPDTATTQIHQRYNRTEQSSPTSPGPEGYPTPTPRGYGQTTHTFNAIALCALQRPTCPQCNGHHDSLGCVAVLHQPSGRKGRSPQRHKYQKNATESHPHPPNPPRPSGVANVGPTTAIATHTHTTSQNHCSQDCRDIIDTCNAPGPDIAPVWTCPTPVYTHTEGDAQTKHRARAIVLCALRRPTCP